MHVKAVYISKVTQVTPVFKHCTWFRCCMSFCFCCHLPWEYWIWCSTRNTSSLLSPSTQFLYQYFILHILEINTVKSHSSIFLLSCFSQVMFMSTAENFFVQSIFHGCDLLLLFSEWQLLFLTGYCSVWEKTI